MAAMFLFIGMSACASIAGNQPRFLDLRNPEAGVSGYRVQAALLKFSSPKPSARNFRTPRQYRDDVVRFYLAVIEAQYGDFRTTVESEGRELGLGLDLAQAGYMSWASVARDSIVNELSAIASGVGSARGAVNRNLYGERTLPAILASMDAQRTRIIARIEQGLTNSETEYSLSAAFFDLARLESAGSLSRATENLTGSAVQAREAAEQELSTVVDTCQVVEDDAIDLTSRVASFVQGLASSDPNDLPARTQALQQVGLLVGVDATTVVSVTAAQLSTLIRRRLVAGQDGRCAAADLQTLIDRIKSQTGRDVP